MFTEILRIKAILDGKTAKEMEKTLVGRFARVADRFGAGLKSVIKGSILGISIGLLSKLLNPLESLEEKIKTLLGQGTDLKDLADEFGTSTGKIKRLQDVARSIGVSPADLTEMMKKFAEAVNKARDEIANPVGGISASTQAVRGFVNQKDMAEGFFQFLQSLKAEGKGAGRDVFFSDREIRRNQERIAKGQPLSDEERQRLIDQRLLRHMTGQESRRAIEKEIFGDKQVGANRRLIDADFPKEFKKVNEPSVAKLDKASNRLADMADIERAKTVKNTTQDFLNASGKITGKMVNEMTNAAKAQMDKETKQLQSYDDLSKAREAIDKVQSLLQDALILVNKGIGYLADIASAIGKIKDSRLWRSWFGGN